MKKIYAYFLVIGLVILSSLAVAQDNKSISVTKDNYANAMADMAMNKEFLQGANNIQWHHHYNVMQLDKQPAPMMNRDTKYSFSIMDGGGDVAITLPETDGRYMSLHVWNDNHVTYKVFYGPGRYVIPASMTSDYFVANVRIQVDAKDPEDIKKTSEFQDLLEIEYLNGYEPQPFQVKNWDMEEFMKVHQHYVQVANEKGVEGSMGTLENPVSKEDTNRGISIATGLLPDEDAAYLTANYKVEKGNSYTVTYNVPELKDTELGFYSITVYGDDQHLKTDEGSSISNREIQLNADGKTFDIHYVFEEDFQNRPNELIMPSEDFWINMRVYIPAKSIIDGEYNLPNINTQREN
ncbi:DUF1214 domain-containing protein [Flammeovirga sp. EKP202]|uniref:DUF1214 domain-containing protein n=1 Tax=Flammeovirga sp. EKP202 TaxID=2770592 RepID=UPI00165FEEF7|nr:DUF1214 domain-containing protein [Flammeovirga sp. EKP202]MBD0405325.1 DUF1214 domain-containing protein [Flammeovirga sp. EKP202]